MFCSHCGQALLPGAQFCGSCGRPAVATTASGVNEFLQGFVSVSLKEIVLFDKITSAEILKSPVFRFLCLFALTPLAILVFDTNNTILNALAIWSGVFWALLLFRLFADRELHFGWAVGMVLFTAFVVLPVFEFYLWLPPHITEWLIDDKRFLPVRFIGYVFGVGFREEMCKALPLIALALLSSKMKNPLNGLVLGMMSGIGFAIAENVYYVHRVHGLVLDGFVKHLQQSGKLSATDFDAFVFPVYNNVVRMMTGPFGHGVYSGIFGYFISLAAADRSRRVPLFLAGLGLSSFLHGTYDTFATPIMGVLIKAFNFFLLMTYVLKARGLTSAKELAGGLFSRTVIGRAPVPPSSRPAPERGPIELVPATASVAGGSATVALQIPSSPESTIAIDATMLAAWHLRGVGGPSAGKSFVLDGEVRIGRDPVQCLVHLEENVVSRQHAVLNRDAVGNGWQVRRLSSTGPLYVNGQAVDDALLKPGDQVQVGSSVFLVETA
jgi:RsiW-degrading membrane proteinase PrsW (M82 family)